MSEKRETDSLLDPEKDTDDSIPTEKEHKEDQNETYIKTIQGVLVTIFLAMIMAVSKICVQALNEVIEHLQLNAMRLSMPSVGLIMYYIFKREWPTVESKYWTPIALFCLASNFITLCMYMFSPFLSMVGKSSAVQIQIRPNL